MRPIQFAIFLVATLGGTSAFRSNSKYGFTRSSSITPSLQGLQRGRSPLVSSVDIDRQIIMTDDESTESTPKWDSTWSSMVSTSTCIILPLILLAVIGAPGSAIAADSVGLSSVFDPSQFQPVCPASDGVYQFLKIVANGLVGQENVVEYGPLIASVLLRVRLELCVLESFLYEAVIPFVQKKGLSWVLPLHETVETFLAGTIFAIASNFILLGSTKILSVLFIYLDALTGMPARFMGGTIKKTAPKDSPGSAFGFGLKAYGDVVGSVRSVIEAGDTFVGRYLVIATTAYIAFKFAHFKLFNDLF